MAEEDSREQIPTGNEALEQVERFLMSKDDPHEQPKPRDGERGIATSSPREDLHNAEQAEKPQDWPDDVPWPGEPRARRAKGLKSPESPSEEELQEHLLTHLPYKDWCEICVACRRANLPHFKSMNATDQF